MKFHPTKIEGLWRVEAERISDERGFFARSWCDQEFREQGPRMPLDMPQASISFNTKAGTLRGMHYVAHPYREAKLVRCTAGAVFDVILDLRRDSPSFLVHQAFELSQQNRDALFIPPGCAHGFQTLMDDTEVLYLMSERFDAAAGRGVRWNDPAFGIAWPQPPRSAAGNEHGNEPGNERRARIINARDANYPDFDPALHATLHSTDP